VENLPASHPRLRVLRGDVADPAAVRAALEGSAGCFHLAAIASVARANEAWQDCHRVNQTGTVAVLDAARAAGGLPVVYASSAAVYGDTGGATAEEGLRPAPQTAYGVDKYGSELHAAIAWPVHGVPSLGCRFFNVYGPRQDPSSPYSGVISIFARRAAEGAALTVHGDGQQVRDFIHVSDVVAHLRAAMRRIASRGAGAFVCNVCTGRGTSILALARRIAAEAATGEAGAPVPVRHGPARAGDIRHSVGATLRAERLLGLSARVPLEAGLAATCRDLIARARTPAADPAR
jgi:UDP-glucose 4-epimerase